MATCERCRGDSFSGWRGKKPTGEVNLLWLCDGCKPDSPIEPRKPRGLNYYRRFTFQILLPVMATIFAMVELGIHL